MYPYFFIISIFQTVDFNPLNLSVLSCFVDQAEEYILAENLMELLVKLAENPKRWERTHKLLSKYTTCIHTTDIPVIL